jgi:hypothetical protein
MELIENYVRAVGERLHPSRREDIEAELRASIHDALEARGADPGSEEDVIPVLTALGAPERMASGYQPNRWYLIGPELFPLFRRVLRLALVTIVVASAAGFAITLMLGGFAGFRAGDLLMTTLGYAVRAALAALVVIVAGFAWLQRAEVRVPTGAEPATEPWDPRSLAHRHRADRAPRFDSLAALVISAVVLVIIGAIGGAAREGIVRAPASLRPLLQDGVVVNAVILQGALVLSALAHMAALVQGRWEPWTRVARLVAESAVVLVFARVPLQLLAHRQALLEAGLHRNLVSWLVINAALVASILVAVVGVAWWRAWRRRRPDGPAAAVPV